MSRLAMSIAGSTILALYASPALADSEMFAPSSFDVRADVFEAADIDNDNLLSRREYTMLRLNTIDDRWVRGYRGDTRDAAEQGFALSFGKMDLDANGRVTATEFANAPAITSQATASATSWATDWGWDPEYMTVSYYLIANPIDTGTVEGRTVVDMDGEEIGEIRRIIHTDEDDGDRYYAMINLDGWSDINAYGTEHAVVGVPLDDLLLFDADHSLMLTTRGEEYIEDADVNRVDLDDYEVVDTLYGVWTAAA